MRKLNSKFKTSFISEEGTYLQNKDYFAYIELDKFGCYAIADGIDNDTENESAQIAVTTFIKLFTQNPTMNRFTLRKYLNIVNKELVNSSRNVRLKASLTIAITNYSKVRYIVLGNSRFYFFKDGYLKERSKDLSLTQQLSDKEIIALDKAAQHIERNNLSCYLGENKLSSPFISKKIKLNDGDVFTLLTKGIWENCDEKEIEDALEGATEPQEVADRVEDMILSKQLSKLENYTLAVTFVEKAYVNPKKKAIIKKILFAAIPIILVLVIALVIFNIKQNKKRDEIASMNNYISEANGYIENRHIEKANSKYEEALKIANKYKLKNHIKEIDDECKYTEIIIEGDKKLEEKKFNEALDQYLLAMEKGEDTDDKARDYISKKIDITKTCISVADLLELADSQLEAGKVAEAEENYLEAKRLASNYYLKDEKKEAIDKLKEIYEQQGKEAEAKKQEEEKAKAEEEKAKEEEEKNKEKEEEAKKEEDELQGKAIDLRKNGDTQYIEGDYVGAKMYYTLAKEAFEKINSNSLANALEKKIVLMDKKIEEQSQTKAEGDIYLNEANERYTKGDITSAKVLYTLARDAYSQVGLTEEIKSIDEKLKVLDKEIASTGDKNE
ncbi:PP2C family protein-serine/threonine phosphatase [Clostridium taeniosporum]|uniref:Serine/threonine protein phosphatase n=1 Tax=Clostridium taeniosporum TaxID=394958 RepID=A0A1D7XJG5_9CLOT|nr:serine/threonine protein phosphatase [Clostridium taeniosporum]AOR23473.1 serine/threonine protein phosphatase [Clostridium taeniosporum]